MNISTMQPLSSDPVVALKLTADEVAQSLVSELKDYICCVREQSQGTFNVYTLLLPPHPNKADDPAWARCIASKVQELALQKLEGGATLHEEGGGWSLRYEDGGPQVRQCYGDWAHVCLNDALRKAEACTVDLSLPDFEASSHKLSDNAALKAWYPQGLSSIEVARAYGPEEASAFIRGFRDQVYGWPYPSYYPHIAWHVSEYTGVQIQPIADYKQAKELRQRGWLVQDEATRSPLARLCSCGLD